MSIRATGGPEEPIETGWGTDETEASPSGESAVASEAARTARFAEAGLSAAALEAHLAAPGAASSPPSLPSAAARTGEALARMGIQSRPSHPIDNESAKRIARQVGDEAPRQDSRTYGLSTPPRFERALAALQALTEAGAIDARQAERIAFDLFKEYRMLEAWGRDSSPLNRERMQEANTRLLEAFERFPVGGRYRTLDTDGDGVSDAREIAGGRCEDEDERLRVLDADRRTESPAERFAAEAARARRELLAPPVPRGFGKFTTYYGDEGNALVNGLSPDGKIEVQLGEPLHADSRHMGGQLYEMAPRSVRGVRFGAGSISVSEEEVGGFGRFVKLEFKGPGDPRRMVIIAQPGQDGWRYYVKTNDREYRNMSLVQGDPSRTHPAGYMPLGRSTSTAARDVINAWIEARRVVEKGTARRGAEELDRLGKQLSLTMEPMLSAHIGAARTEYRRQAEATVGRLEADLETLKAEAAEQRRYAAESIARLAPWVENGWLRLARKEDGKLEARVLRSKPDEVTAEQWKNFLHQIESWTDGLNSAGAAAGRAEQLRDAKAAQLYETVMAAPPEAFSAEERSGLFARLASSASGTPTGRKLAEDLFTAMRAKQWGHLEYHGKKPALHALVTDPALGGSTVFEMANHLAADSGKRPDELYAELYRFATGSDLTDEQRGALFDAATRGTEFGGRVTDVLGEIAEKLKLEGAPAKALEIAKGGFAYAKFACSMANLVNDPGLESGLGAGADAASAFATTAELFAKEGSAFSKWGKAAGAFGKVLTVAGDLHKISQSRNPTERKLALANLGADALMMIPHPLPMAAGFVMWLLIPEPSTESKEFYNTARRAGFYL